MKRRVMVDMSATLLHHGHIRLLRQASELGTVVVALTTDKEIEEKKGYIPELNYEERREILESIRYVDEVVPSPWLIEESFLDEHRIDWLIHGHDNSNHIGADRLRIVPRTDGVSSQDLRRRVLESMASMLKKRLESN